jgi:4-hydroxy-tetrahydrodipicolinate synthase
VISGGVQGLFVLGTTGEGPSLSYQIRYEMVERTCEVVAGRVPVLVGITDSCLAESLQLAEHAANSQAAAVVAAAPFYYAVSQTELKAWFHSLADKSPLPVLLYNMPGCVGINLELATVVELAQHPNIIGVKDSGGDLSYFQQLCREFTASDFIVFMGPEELLPEAVAAGADGGVCGGANLLPHVYVNLFNAAKANDAVKIAAGLQIVEDVFASIYRDPQGVMNLIPALKRAMEHCGLCTSTAAPPLPQLSTGHAEQIQHRLNHLLHTAESSLTQNAIHS